MDRDWEEGLPWLLLAACEVNQESIGFSPKDLVFGHKVCGPLTLTDLNYLISTPDRRKKTQLCHINLLKSYVDRIPSASHAVEQSYEGVARPVCLASRVSTVHAPEFVAAEVEDGLPDLDPSVLQGRLKNSETLCNLDGPLGHLPESDRLDLEKLIFSFPCLFGDTPTQTNVIEHDIDVGDAQPIRQRFYRVNPEKRRYLDAEIDYMLKNGSAEPSNSSWASPCLFVPKSDNTPTFCTNYRKVNAVTKPDSFPLPRMEDCVDQVGTAKYVSKFDLLKGYWQVPLSDRAREIASFITPNGPYSYKVMPFGLRNAPATFQRSTWTML